MFDHIAVSLKRTPIFYRIAIGNGLIIVLSAIFGTILTRFLTNITSTVWHFVLFVTIGILISLATNIIILRAALQPLRDLRQTVNRIQAGRSEIDRYKSDDTDPDIYQLSKTINSLILQLEETNQQLRILSERAISAQEEERKRIARSLHDETGQSLSSLIISLERLEQHLPADEPGIIDRLGSLRTLASNSLDSLRSIIYDLRPAILDDLGLIPAIRWYARTNLEEAGIQAQLDFPEDLPSLPQPLATTLFRITQECVTNIIRHSQANKACISLSLNENEVYLKITDDGHGFDQAMLNADNISTKHWGLLGIQERVDLVRGKLTIISNLKQGTTLTVSIPLQKTNGKKDG